jgi:hypothetical protein
LPPDTELRRTDARARPREATSLVSSLLDLPKLAQADQRTLFRQAIAELARAATEEGPGPLEGMRPETLAASIGLAIDSGLVEDLDWLDPGAAGAALYTIAAALPPGNAQRDLGRRVLGRLLSGNAATFAQIATQMARAGGKGLTSPAAVARVSLLFEIPIGLGLLDGPLALALASRRQLRREYVIARSTRSLADRRLAARLIERAAGEAARRAARGDRSALRLVGPRGPLEAVWDRLSADREPLVWRHVAIARGILAAFTDGGREAIEKDLSDRLSATEWRRALAALGGLAAHDPTAGLELAKRTVAPLLKKDPGAVAPFLWGLGRAAEAEPETALELVDLATTGTAADFADAVLFLRRELGACELVDHAARVALDRLREPREKAKDDGVTALMAELVSGLEGTHANEPLLTQADEALDAFAGIGARAAQDKAQPLLDAARGAVESLLAIGDEASSPAAMGLTRRASFSVVRDLDMGLLERRLLDDLMHLDTRAERVRSGERTLEELRARVFEWILDRELRVHGEDEAAHLMVHLARLRALLHLLDSELSDASEEGGGAAWDRWRSAAERISSTLKGSPPRGLRRALMATWARSLDALARSGACDISDVVMVAAGELELPPDLDTLAEASMDPDTRQLLSSFAGFTRAVRGEVTASLADDDPESLYPPAAMKGPVALALDALERVTDELAEAGTARADALRAVLVKLHHALVTSLKATSLRDLSPSGVEADVALAVENATFALSQIHVGARGRALGEDVEVAHRSAASRALSSTVSRALVEREPIEAFSDASSALGHSLPGPFAKLVDLVIAHVADLPQTSAEADSKRAEHALDNQLPAWVPARRVIGAYYVERPLAAGGVGSVFVVTRIEDRHDPSAERFALKVPDYNANAARHLSEEEFLKLFRGEASALVSLPQHPAIAHFVTFDLAARPKPILVMELVEGPNLERLIDARTFDTARALRAMHQVLEGLQAMHEVGVGHLDLKPGNVVLRGGDDAVLVDFGLAGRNIRPGCGSAPYSAPEIWGVAPAGSKPTPMAADVYAFACLAFEMLTGMLLFDGETEVQLVSQHVAHDGLPPRLRALASNPRLVPIAELLFAALRRDPERRVPVADLIPEFERRTAGLEDMPWPIALQ